jgi:hypothetical protein
VNKTFLGFKVSAWCKVVGISRGMFYRLEGDMAPRTAKIGDRRIVVEQPEDYLNRITTQQQAAV